MLEENRFSDEDAMEPEAGEVERVLAALRGLLAQTDSPIVRSCLQEAHDDIAHLAGCDAGPADSAEEDDAA